MLTVAFVFPFTRLATHQRLRRRWSARILAVLGVKVRALGDPIAPGALLVANHISWLDVLVINALVPAAFIAKADVRQWPVIGWLAARNETVFLRRGSHRHASVVNGEIAALLAAGRNVALFPEGTSTDGSHVLPFHGALLQPAIDAGHPVQPVAIAYLAPGGEPSRAPAYHGDVTLGESFSAVLAEPTTVAVVQVGTPIPSANGYDRRGLARLAREAIVARIEATTDDGPTNTVA